MRLINADACIDDIRNNNQQAWEALAYAPTIDAVEVVRCKDCKYSGVNEEHPNKPILCYLTKMCGTTTPNWFCASGERREE